MVWDPWLFELIPQSVPGTRLSDFIEKIAVYDWQLSAKQAVDNIPSDQLDDAWNWAATYLVELRARISTDNVEVRDAGWRSHSAFLSAVLLGVYFSVKMIDYFLNVEL